MNEPDQSPSTRPDDKVRILWLTLPESRPNRELYWLHRMPRASVTAVGEVSTSDPIRFEFRPYRRLTRRFVEAGALAWFRDLESVPGGHDWVGSLELCALVTAQAAKLAARRRMRHVVLTWGNDHRNPLYRIPPYREATQAALRADRFVCFIQAAREHLLELGVDPARCSVVFPPLDTSMFHPPPDAVDEPVAIFVSPLAANKGIDRVLAAFALVRARLPEARLRVVGRGPLEPMVRAAAEASGGAIEHLGPRDRFGVADELRRAAVFVTAPRPTAVWNEQFGLAYVEAMACGLPVVTTICGTNHEAVRAPNIRVPDDPEALAEALTYFLADPDRRRWAGALNRAEAVERYEMTQQLAKLREVFAETDHPGAVA